MTSVYSLAGRELEAAGQRGATHERRDPPDLGPDLGDLDPEPGRGEDDGAGAERDESEAGHEEGLCGKVMVCVC